MVSSLFTAVPLIVYLATQVQGHAIITPALGGGTARSDVQRPSTATPCGTVNVAQTINNSTAIPATGGEFDATITNFNAGVDGSRQVTAEVDPTGTGKSFTATGVTVKTNGDEDPTNVGSQPLVVQLPAGTACKGGASGNVCLVSFKTAGGFGNCVAVSSGASTGGAASPPAAASSAAATPAKAAANNVATAPKSTTSVKAKMSKHKKGKNSGKGGKGTGKKGKGKGKKAADQTAKTTTQ